MHISADFVTIAVNAIKNYALSKKYTKIEITSENDVELNCIAEALADEFKNTKIMISRL
jgi:hypothetical protein